MTANIRCGLRPPDAYGFIDWSCHVDLIDFCWLYDNTSAVANLAILREVYSLALYGHQMTLYN